MRELSPQQKRNVSELMKSGFEGYASTHGDRMRIGAVIDSPEKNTALIRSYGMEFVRILSQSEWTELREDLFFLTEKGCPALDIIQLTFACTRGRSLATSDTLAGIGLADPSLQMLAELCRLVSEKIAALDNSHGLVHRLSELMPELPDDEERAQLVEKLRELPDLLGFYSNLLRLYPPKKELNAQLEPIQKDYELVLLYNLFNHYGLGFPTLSRLLMAMRSVRFAVSKRARYVHKLSPAPVRRSKGTEDGETSLRDPLGVAALQKRLHRFSKQHKDWHLLIVWSVLRYVSDEWSIQRAGGETLLDLMPQIMRKRLSSAIPVVVSPIPVP